ncbi:MAG TPA: 4-hydroxy-tetrahydrodipicolinate synthase [Solirubrobacteraceae bacterium]
MASDFRPTGVFVPLVTPFDQSGEVDLDSLRSVARRVLEDGASGVVALATTGEPTSLDDGELKAVLEVCASVCAEYEEKILIVGASTNDTRTTIARHEALSDIAGVSASLAVVPYYVRPSESAIVRHFQVVAERSPVPVLLYNIPYRTGQGLGADALLELADTENIAGVKQAVGSIDQDTLRLLAEAADRFAVIGGDDQFLFPLALMGATGAIAASAHLCTARFVRMIRCALDGELAEGREHSRALLPVVSALFAEPSPAVIKAALHARGEIPTPNVRMPLANASPEATQLAVGAVLDSESTMP